MVVANPQQQPNIVCIADSTIPPGSVPNIAPDPAHDPPHIAIPVVQSRAALIKLFQKIKASISGNRRYQEWIALSRPWQAFWILVFAIMLTTLGLFLTSVVGIWNEQSLAEKDSETWEDDRDEWKCY